MWWKKELTSRWSSLVSPPVLAQGLEADVEPVVHPALVGVAEHGEDLLELHEQLGVGGVAVRVVGLQHLAPPPLDLGGRAAVVQPDVLVERLLLRLEDEVVGVEVQQEQR